MCKKFERIIISEMLEIFEKVINNDHFESIDSIDDFYYYYYNTIQDCPEKYIYTCKLLHHTQQRSVDNGYVIEIKIGHKKEINANELTLYITINNKNNTIGYSVCEEIFYGTWIDIKEIIERLFIPINNTNKLEFRNIFMEMLDEVSDKFFLKTRAKSARK